MMTNRGEYAWNEETRPTRVLARDRELSICHLFYGHELELKSRFLIVGIIDNFQQSVSASVEIHEGRPGEQQVSLFDLINEDSELRELDLVIRWDYGQEREEIKLPLSPNGGFSTDYVRRLCRNTKNGTVRTQFITSSSLTTSEMMDLFDQVVLKPEEKIVTNALQNIEPSIERIAAVSSERSRSGGRGGFVIRLSGNDQRIPIGSMGDGIWRMLGLTLAVVNARGGILLIDEIDTGLHFSVMSDMWKLIWKTAKELNVQVFATTHNSDCWSSLADIANQENTIEEGITIQRIERSKETSIVFSEREIVVAAERGIEVR